MPATLLSDLPETSTKSTNTGAPFNGTLSSPGTPAARVEKLDALTSLRFFAALMIFIGHATALSAPNRPNYTEGLALWQGVSFFFVLSGFILAYVYPSIDSIAGAGKFLTARFARIWPTHLVAFIVALLLVPQCAQTPNFLAAALVNLSMLQVWTLDPALASSFNRVSWTISVELFFYVCFPFLIKDFDKPFKTRWITMSVLALSFVLLCLIPCFPGCGGYNFSEPIYVGFNPLCRLAEFILGLWLCRLFTQGKLLGKLTTSISTVLEIIALSLAAAAVCLPTIWPAPHDSNVLFIIRSCILDIGGAPAYGALILLMASEKGLISKLLTKKLFVGLGEISFSLYMFHLSIIFFLVKYQPSFGNQPDWLLPAIAFILCLCVSHLNFVFIETPCRQSIMALVKRPGKSNGSTSYLHNFRFTTVTEICLLALIVIWVHTQYRFIPPAVAARVESHSVPVLRGIDFGGKFKLRGLKLTRQRGGLQVEAIWQSLSAQTLDYVNAVQLISAEGKVVSSHDYLQDGFQRRAAAGQIWADKFYLSAAQLKHANKIGMSVFQPATHQPLVAKSAQTDWDGRRLLISLE